MVSIFWLPALYQTKTTSTKVVIFKVIPLEAANVEYTYFLTSRASLLSVCCISYDQAVTTWKVCDCNPFWMMTFFLTLNTVLVNRVLFDDRGSGIVRSRVESPGFRGGFLAPSGIPIVGRNTTEFLVQEFWIIDSNGKSSFSMKNASQMQCVFLPCFTFTEK